MTIKKGVYAEVKVEGTDVFIYTKMEKSAIDLIKSWKQFRWDYRSKGFRIPSRKEEFSFLVTLKF